MTRVMSPQRKTFAKHMARTGDPAYSATKASYANPELKGYALAKDPRIVDFTRALQQKFAREEAGAIAIGILVDIGTDPKQPAGARVQAAKELRSMSGIGLVEGQDDKDPSEMTGDELHNMLAKIDRQREALQRVAADRAQPIIDNEPETGLFD